MSLIGKNAANQEIEKKRKGKKTRVRMIGQERQTIKSESKRALVNEF